MHHIWAYLLIIALVALEGEIVILVAAGAASTGFLNPLGVLCAGTLGNLLSDVLWYALGYYSPLNWVIKRFRWIGITPEKMDAALRIVKKDAIRLLIFSKLTNWMAIPALIATGMAKVHWKSWLPLIVASDIVIAVIFTPIGYYMSSSLIKISKRVALQCDWFYCIIYPDRHVLLAPTSQP